MSQTVQANWKKWATCLMALLIIGVTGCGSSKQPDQAASMQTPQQQKGTDAAKTPASSQGQVPPSTSGADSQSAKKSQLVIDRQMFDQIKHGMTTREVFSIVGGPGQIVSQSGNPDDPLYTVVYQYAGKSPNSFAKLTFRNGQLLKKEQSGLE
jgi:hypothetical protein